MSDSRKKLIIGSIILAIIVLIALFFFFRGGDSGQGGGGYFGGIFPGGGSPIPTGNTPGGTPPPGQNTGGNNTGGEDNSIIPFLTLMPLGSDPVASIVAFGSTTRYYKKSPEQLGYLFERNEYNLAIDKLVANYLVQGIADATWAPDGQKAVIWYRDDNEGEISVKKFFVDYSSSTPRTHVLSDDITYVAFSPDSKTLAYVDSSGDILTTDLAFKKTKKVFSTSLPDIELLWPEKNTLSIKTKSSFAIKGFLYSIDLKAGSLSKIAEGLGIDVKWNTKGDKAAISSVDKAGAVQPLQLFDVKTKSFTPLPVNTLAEKCAFGPILTTVIYCGAPQSFPTSQQPDSWWQGRSKVEDSIVIVDTSSSPPKLVGAKSLYLDVTEPTLFADNAYFLFIDRTTRIPWAVKVVVETPEDKGAASSTPTQ